MVSCGYRPALTLAAACAAALAACAWSPAAAQSDAAAYDARQRQILERLQELESRGGPYSPALLDELKALIMLYREHDDPALAVVTIERALQVVRANSGLHTLEQVPLLWQRIESEEALGNDQEVWDLEQDLLELVRRYPDDLRAVPVLRQMADRQIAVLRRVLDTNEIPAEVILGCFYNEWPNSPWADGCTAGSRRTVVQGMLAEANRNHADAIAILLRNEAYASEDLEELELELVRGAELIRSEYEHLGRRGVTGTRLRNDAPVPLAPGYGLEAEILEPWRSRIASIVELADWELPYDVAGTPEEEFLDQPEPRDARFKSPYLRGRQSLRRLYSYAAADSGSALARATAIVRIADWDLLFSRNGTAVDGYLLARGMLDDSQAEAAAVAELFAPRLPVVLPSFEPNPLARDDSRPVTGHIDVAFSITKYGRVDDVEILGGDNAAKAARDELVVLLKRSRFRPRFTAEGRVETTPLVLRFYLQPDAES